MPWLTSEIADVVVQGLRRRAKEDDVEQAVYGLDAEDELGLHPLIQAALRTCGWGVWPEQRYPSDWAKPKHSEGQRCDVVLTHDNLPLRDPLIRGTLFDAIEAEEPEHAYWLEIKTVAQYEISGPFARYSAELLWTVTQDVKKLWSDPVIRHAGLLLVLFAESHEITDHDLGVWHQRCLGRGYPVAVPEVAGFDITDRIGNAWCAVALFGLRT